MTATGRSCDSRVYYVTATGRSCDDRVYHVVIMDHYWLSMSLHNYYCISGDLCV